MAAAGLHDQDIFPTDTIHEIHCCSRGIPRVVNLLCEHALITAYGENRRVVTTAMIRRIAGDFGMAPGTPVAGEEQRRAELPNRFARLSMDPGPGSAPAPMPAMHVAPPITKAAAMAAHVAAASASEMHVSRVMTASPVPPARVVGAMAPAPEILPAPVRTVAPPAAQKAPVEVPIEERAHGTPMPTRMSQEFVEIPKYWRRSGSHKRRSAKVRRDGPRWNWTTKVRQAVVGIWTYWRQVMQSFVVDCRRVTRAMTLPTPALALPESGVKEVSSKNWITPIANWLRHPMNSRSVSTENGAERAVQDK